jgi:hypothetical protein
MIVHMTWVATLVLLASTCAASDDAVLDAMNPPGAHWNRGDNIAFVGDHRGSSGNLAWMDRLLARVRSVPPVGQVGGYWARCDTAPWLAGEYSARNVNLRWSVAVMMYGASDAQLSKPTEPSVFAQSLRNAVVAMQNDGVILIMATPMPCGDRKAGNPLDVHLDTYADAIRNLAADGGITLVDLRREASAWLSVHNTEDKPDGLLSVMNAEKRWVLTDQGHAFVVERLAAAIGRAMQGAPMYLDDLPGGLPVETEIALRPRRVTPGAEVQIRYAIDGKDPSGKDGKIYKGPFRLRKADSIAVSMIEGTRATTVTHRFAKDPISRAPDRAPITNPGLKVEVWQGRNDTLPDFATLGSAAFTGVCHAPDASFGSDAVAPQVPETYYAMRLSGFIEVQREGWYEFHLGSDDGSRMLLGDDVLIENDGKRGVVYKSAGLALKPGRHAITIHYIQVTGTRSLQLLYEGPGIRRSPVPDAAYSYDPKEKRPR